MDIKELCRGARPVMFSERQIRRFKEMFRIDRNFPEYDYWKVCVGPGLIFTEIGNELESEGIQFEITFGRVEIIRWEGVYLDPETVNFDYVNVVYNDIDKAINIIKRIGVQNIIFSDDIKNAKEISCGVYEL